MNNEYDHTKNRELEALRFNRHRLLLEFSRDMDRNASDEQFAQSSENTIHYVFDENVFEHFIGAKTQSQIPAKGHFTSYSDKRNFSSVFHTLPWRKQKSGNKLEKKWISTNRQIAIITSEYLLFGKLPGQKNSEIYISQWHWAELEIRLEILLEHFKKKSQDLLKNQSKKQSALPEVVSSILDLAENDKYNFQQFKNEIQKKKFYDINEIVSDIDLMSELARQEKNEISSTSLKGHLATRIIASLLADDETIMPLVQIKRIRDEPSFGRKIIPLMFLDRTPSIDYIIEFGKDWHTRIEAEIKIKNSFTRPRNSIQSDSYTLAYVQYVSDQLPSNERICFVTGDELIFDTYRRWWIENSDRSFIMRRISQYIPLLNFRNTNSGIVADQEVFDNIQMAIEPALLFLNLGRDFFNRDLTDKNARYHISREHFALLLKEGNFQDSIIYKLFFGQKDIETHNMYGEVRDNLQEIERFSIGVSDELIEKRYDSGVIGRLNALLESPDGLKNFINERLTDIYEVYAVQEIPRTLSLISEWLNIESASHDTRAPLVLITSFSPKSKEATKITEFSDRILVTSIREKLELDIVFSDDWVRNRPDLFYAFAATTAIRLSYWEKAEKYADIALKAHKSLFNQSTKNANLRPPSYEDYLELKYLHSLTIRFKIGMLLPRDENSFSRKYLFKLAEKKLESQLSSLPPKNKLYGKFCNYRVNSELLALHLFNISNLLVNRNMIDQTKTDQKIRYLFEIVFKKISELNDQETLNLIKTENIELDFKKSEVQIIEYQICANIVSSYCLANMFSKITNNPIKLKIPDKVLQDCLRLSQTRIIEKKGPKSHRIVKAEFYLFSILYGKEDKHISNFKELPLDARLLLDYELLKLYQSNYSDDSL